MVLCQAGDEGVDVAGEVVVGGSVNVPVSPWEEQLPGRAGEGQDEVRHDRRVAADLLEAVERLTRNKVFE